MDINDIGSWIDVVKGQKSMWVKSQPNPDMNPTVFVERQGVIRAIIVSPNLDKWEGLQAARICRLSFAADALTLVFDAHVAVAKKGESKEEFAKRYPVGSMQKMCDEQGACKTREITDCLACHRITENGQMSMVLLPYIYGEKDQGTFEWLEAETNKFSTTEKDTHLEGTIPGALSEIMRQDTILTLPETVEMRESLSLSPERALYHGARAALTVLTTRGFLCYHLEDAPNE